VIDMVQPTLTFLGAAGTVTGSRFLVEGAGARVLVDAGLYQGPSSLRRRNWDEFPVDPASIDEVVLTHAHLDHTGYLPRLVKEGFRGPVRCTPETAELAAIVLRDSAHLQEEDALYANRTGFSKHRPAPPFIDRDRVQRPLPGLDFKDRHGLRMRLGCRHPVRAAQNALGHDVRIRRDLAENSQ